MSKIILQNEMFGKTLMLNRDSTILICTCVLYKYIYNILSTTDFLKIIFAYSGVSLKAWLQFNIFKHILNVIEIWRLYNFNK